ncbi:MAG: hypothetical protein ACFHVJ_08615 [Aestuariibacter sp.]
MMQINPRCLLGIAGLMLLFPVAHVVAVTKEAGRPVDDAYAEKVWRYMIENELVGESRMRTFPFVGLRPHGSIQDVITTKATIAGHEGRLIVKHNYGAKDDLTVKQVYASEQKENLEAVTIMFQRETGYDAENNDWFWAEYEPNGAIFVYQGAHLSGRAPLCIGCHAPLGGEDREILNGNKH